MVNIQLDLSYIDNTIRTSLYELRFKYNTDADYFYFDFYNSNGDLLQLHNRVVTGYDYGGVSFVSNTNSSYASEATIESFTAVVDG